MSGLLPLVLAASPICLCPAGIGSFSGESPFLRAHAGPVTLVACGRSEAPSPDGTVRASTFEISRCDTGSLVLTVGETRTAVVRRLPDGLEVKVVVRLPAGKEQVLSDVPVLRTTMTASPDGELTVRSEHLPPKVSMSPRDVKATLVRLDQAIAAGAVGEDLLARLAAAALAGSRAAELRFRDLPQVVPLEGRAKETYFSLARLLELPRR